MTVKVKPGLSPAELEAFIQRRNIDREALDVACERAANNVRDTNRRIVNAPGDFAENFDIRFDSVFTSLKRGIENYDDGVEAIRKIVKDKRKIAVGEDCVFLAGKRSLYKLWERPRDRA